MNVPKYKTPTTAAKMNGGHFFIIPHGLNLINRLAGRSEMKPTPIAAKIENTGIAAPINRINPIRELNRFATIIKPKLLNLGRDFSKRANIKALIKTTPKREKNDILNRKTSGTTGSQAKAGLGIKKRSSAKQRILIDFIIAPSFSNG